ncbi:MAG: hypothetical protein ACTSRP_00655 [Candidatus Helarchaeota archaeon]
MDWQIYAVPGLRIKYPKDWYFQDQDFGIKQMLVLFSEKKVDCTSDRFDFTRNVNISAEIIKFDTDEYKKLKGKPVELLNKYVENKIKTLKINIDDLELLKKEEVEIKKEYRLFKGDHANKLIYKGKYVGHSLKWYQYYTIIGGDIICILTATANEDDFTDDFTSIVEEMIDSMELSA